MTTRVDNRISFSPLELIQTIQSEQQISIHFFLTSPTFLKKQFFYSSSSKNNFLLFSNLTIDNFSKFTIKFGRSLVAFYLMFFVPRLTKVPFENKRQGQLLVDFWRANSQIESHVTTFRKLRQVRNCARDDSDNFNQNR